MTESERIEKSLMSNTQVVAETFSDIIKFNPYHGKDGRFTGPGAATSFTYKPGQGKMYDNAIAREKERTKNMGGGGGSYGLSQEQRRERANQRQQEERDAQAKRKAELDARVKEELPGLSQDAIRAANNVSFFDHGSVTAREALSRVDEYRNRNKIDDDWTDEQKAYAKQREEEYKQLLTEYYNDSNRRFANNPSWMVTGPARYNTRANEKKLNAARNKADEYEEKLRRHEENTQKRIKNMASEETQISYWRNGRWKNGETIDAADPLAERKMQAKLDYLTESQQKMKDANAYYRRNNTMTGFEGYSESTNSSINRAMADAKSRGYGGNKPFASYQLTNNNAQIKATQSRLNQIKSQKERAATSGNSGGRSFNGGTMKVNNDINRLQLVFDGKPSAEVRAQLKANGFRWSPTQGAWQRQNTPNAERAAERIMESLNKSYVERSAVSFSEIVKSMSDLLVNEVPENAMSFSEIIKFNPYHDKRGRFSSANGFASFSANPDTNAGRKAIERRKQRESLEGEKQKVRQYGATNTKDALEEINSGKHNSLEKYMDKDGKLTPEREEVHKQIINKLLYGKDPVEGQATMTLLGGGPASGKSSVMNPDTSNKKHDVTVDPDAIKELLPGYKEMAQNSSDAAAFYHEESSALAKRFSEVAYKENYNVVYDGTGDGSVGSVMKKVNAAKANGYRVEAKYVSIDTQEAVRRNQKRYDDAVAQGKTPRLPPVDMVVKTHTKCTDISVEVASKLDYIEIWDNNGARGQQKLIATGGNGRGLVAKDTAAFNRYLNKGSKGIEGFMTLPNGQVFPIVDD